MTDQLIGRVQKLRPQPGDLILVHLEADEEIPDDFKAALGQIASTANVSFVVLPPGTKLEQADERTMAAAGWMRIPDPVREGLTGRTSRQQVRRIARDRATAAVAGYVPERDRTPPTPGETP